MTTVLGKHSTMSKPGRNVKTQDIAFVVDFLGIAPDQVAKLKHELVQKTPMLTLVYTLVDVKADWTYARIVTELSDKSDLEARAYLLRELAYLENILVAAMAARVKTDACRLKIWKLFTHVLADPLREMPANISEHFQTSIIKSRCGVEPTFLDRTREPLTHFKDLFVQNPTDQLDHPLNSKERLCPVVHNLNRISDPDLADTIEQCLDLIDRYTPAGLDLNEDDDDYKKIKADVDNFLQIIHEWDKMNVYTCAETGTCRSKADKLQITADEVREYAQTCSASLQKRHKKHLIKRRKNGDTTQSIGQKLWSWF
jgi:sulfur relay (sulfurtransferase) DsrC/TusE family protein